MPILKECVTCERKGGYAEKDTDKVCYRCKKKLIRKPEKKGEDEDAK